MNVLWITEHVKFENVVGYDMPSCWMRIFFCVNSYDGENHRRCV